jgi:signal transduction histidine kinase
MHAGALAYRDDLPPEQVRETAALIRAKSHEAMADLRQVLGMLRDEELPHRPQPTLADLRSLVEEAATSGLEVDLADSTVEPPPEQVGRTVYRIVQEGLTNARKHGGGAAVQVRVEGGPGRGVSLLLHNRKRPAPGHREPPPSGLGLVGLRERAELNGGWLRVEETAESFSLKGWLPWPA